MVKDKRDPKYTNRLIHEKSPYLLQHAHNPVDWYALGPEAFQKAKREGKPKPSQCLFPSDIPRGDIGPHAIDGMFKNNLLIIFIITP